MGLDMYLDKKIYVGANHDFLNVTGTIELYADGKPIPVNFKRVSEIVENVGYWRKANAIHQWFVDSVQDGNDDCKEYYVSRENMQDLLNIVNEVIADPNKAAELLPTRGGFFFGSTEYDEWYFVQLQSTKDILESVLAEDDGGGYQYHSSW